jgi:hypothetical protein
MVSKMHLNLQKQKPDSMDRQWIYTYFFSLKWDWGVFEPTFAAPKKIENQSFLIQNFLLCLLQKAAI